MSVENIDVIVRLSSVEDVDSIVTLYKKVAFLSPGGIARESDEISKEYVEHNLSQAVSKAGYCFVAVDACSHVIVGEIHCYKPVPRVFKHVLSDLTVVVDPSMHGKGIGRKLFSTVLNAVESSRPDVLRVELIARESNKRALGFYESLGFVKEGRLERRIFDVGGEYCADIPMAWFNKNFCGQ